MSRRFALIAALVGVAAAAVAAWVWLRAPVFVLETRAERNVLLITIDTLRGDALGSYGGRAETPNLDRLAARGARFTFAHAHAVLTLPSHTSLLTGRYPYEHGVRDNNGFRVRKGEVTLATRLKKLGFATGAFISAFPLDQRYGLNADFDVYDDRISEVGKSTDIALPERRADEAVKSALDWIGQQRGKWFGWVHVFDPHAPYKPPPDWEGKYPDNAYASEVAWTDFALGPLLQHLHQQPRPTLVVVTSDHGEGLGDHGEMTHGIFAYEATLRVPLIIAEIVPAAPAPRGTTVETGARLVDVVPTILESLGAAKPSDLAGASLASAIRGGAEADDRPMYFESMMPTLARGWAPLRGVIVGREKHIDLPVAELYDLGSDHAELQNLAQTRSDRVSVLGNVLRGFNVALPNQAAEESAAARERLRALGYTGGSPVPIRDRYTENDDPKRLIDLDQMLHRASEFFHSGRPRESVEMYQKVIARRPDTADAYRNMAFVLWQVGQPAAAIQTLEAAVKNGVSQRDIFVKLGVYLAEAGAAAKAIPLLETLPQDDTEVLNALGIAYAQSGRAGDAMRVFRRALEIDPTSGLAHQNIATLQLRAGDVAGAETSLRQALTIDPTLPGAYTTLGVVLAKTGRPEEAIQAWKRAVELEATEYDALYNLIVQLVAQGRIDDARGYGNRYLSTAPPALYARDIAHVRELLGRR